jgi:hypothetical protein
MKRTLIAICITTVALAVGATAEEQHQNRAAGSGKGKATATTAGRVNRGGNVQRSRQVSTHQKVSGRAVNQHANVSGRANSTTSIARSNSKTTNHVTSRESGFRHDQAAVSNTNTNRVTSRERGNRNQVTANNTVTANSTTNRRFARGENFQRQRALSANSNRNVTINRTRNVNRNVTLVNNWRGERFAGRNYVAFRNYHRSWHDRGWWTSHYPRIIFVGGGPYFWNAGYWYPAWGYNPGYVYPYDGPIYGYRDLTPDQIVENVQQQLRDEGYYDGPIDGILGPQTRYALAAFQADHGLAVTSAVDEPTLSTLGLV